MIIKRIAIKNFKSFGNNIQEILLKPNIGELILLSGRNGAGKSSISDAIDYCLFNKVAGKKKKSVVLSTLPNRLNNNLFTNLEFNVGETAYEIQRSMNPGKVLLRTDNIPYNRTGSKNVNAKIEESINIDLETFKSFISMSINDFKNFMTLTPDEKRRLLDKLFNLGMLNELSKILKNLKTNNQKELIQFDEKITLFQQNILSFNLTVDKIKAAKLESLEEEIKVVREDILSQKEEFLKIQEKIKKIESKELELKQLKRVEDKNLREIEYKLRDFERQLALYANQQCPECGSDLHSEEHIEKQQNLEAQQQQTQKILVELKNKIQKLNKNEEKLNSISSQANKDFGSLKSYLAQLKKTLIQLKDKQTQTDTQEIVELLKNIEKNETRLESASEEKDERIVSQNVFKKLDELFSEDGIKKSIISNIIMPINKYIEENLKLLDISFKVRLNEQFDAKITLLDNEIDVESLSTGETKKVNISIMLAYLKMIRMKRQINILFLDEIFSSIDIEGITSIIHILKNFARRWKVNVFLVHHSILDRQLFDRILHIEKNITTYIREEVIRDEQDILQDVEDLQKISSIEDII